MTTAVNLPMSPQAEPESDRKPDGRTKRQDAIRAGLLRSLGRPADLFKVAVLPLWGDNYRVNVVTGKDATSVRIPYSYFVTADDAGGILRSTPPIRKQY